MNNSYLSNMPMSRLVLCKVICSLLRNFEDNQVEIEQLAQRLAASIAEERQTENVGTRATTSTPTLIDTPRIPSPPSVTRNFPAVTGKRLLEVNHGL